jgi:hypothetical protein
MYIHNPHLIESLSSFPRLQKSSPFTTECPAIYGGMNREIYFVNPDLFGEAIELLKRYNVALNYAINRILRLDLRSVGRVHNALYRELREWFGLPSTTAIDCYRDALANANA